MKLLIAVSTLAIKIPCQQQTSFSSSFSLKTALAVLALGKPIPATIITTLFSAGVRLFAGSSNQLVPLRSTALWLFTKLLGGDLEGLGDAIGGRGSPMLSFFVRSDPLERKNPRNN